MLAPIFPPFETYKNEDFPAMKEKPSDSTVTVRERRSQKNEQLNEEEGAEEMQDQRLHPQGRRPRRDPLLRRPIR